MIDKITATLTTYKTGKINPGNLFEQYNLQKNTMLGQNLIKESKKASNVVEIKENPQAAQVCSKETAKALQNLYKPKKTSKTVDVRL